MIEAITAALGATYDVSTSPTRGPRDAIQLAREAALRGDAAVFAWGGDGTIREVVDGILGSPTTLGVLPGGTFNVVAMALGLPRTKPVEAARRLARSSATARDVGLIGSTPFLMQATAGLDGFLMHNLSAERKARFGIAGVMIDGLRMVSRYRFNSFQVEVDGVNHQVTGAIFVNMTEYAGPFHIVPGARWDDRKAHALLYTGRNPASAVLFAVCLGIGRHHRLPSVTIREATKLTIHPAPGVFLQTDGDAWRGDLPATCCLSPEQIQVLVPASAHRGR